jgi:hypothetical protein
MKNFTEATTGGFTAIATNTGVAAGTQGPLSAFSNSTFAPNIYQIKYRGSWAVPTGVLAGDGLGTIVSWGYDGVAAIRIAGTAGFTAKENFSTTAAGAYYKVATSAVGSVTPADRIYVDETILRAYVPVSSKGLALDSAAFAGTVSSSGTTLTFSSALDAARAGYAASNPTLGYQLIAGGQTVTIISWTNSTTATVSVAPVTAFSTTAITSVQSPINFDVDSAGILQRTTLADGSQYSLNKMPESIVPATLTLSPSQMYGGRINNYGQSLDETLTLIPCAQGMNFSVLLGTTVAKYFRVQPDAGDSIYLDAATAGDGKYVAVVNAGLGYAIQFDAFKTGANKWSWFATSINGPWIQEP